ncbi:unnamed protein product [Ectocarpus sp. 12 AP-2014]
MDFDIDHIQPVKYSGPTHLDNLQVLCTGCHRQKTFHPSKWSVDKDFTGRCDSLYVFQKFENKIVGETTRRKLGCTRCKKSYLNSDQTKGSALTTRNTYSSWARLSTEFAKPWGSAVSRGGPAELKRTTRCNTVASTLNRLLRTHTNMSLVSRKRQVAKKRNRIYKIVGSTQ